MNKHAVIALALSLVTAGPAAAFSVSGSNITTYDGDSNSQDWHGTGEDQEVEPGMAHGQHWDAEAMYMDGDILTMVAGFDFVNGVSGYESFASGDIFIDTDGNYMPGNEKRSGNGFTTEAATTFGYELVIDLDFDTNEYSVYSLAGQDVTSAYYGKNFGSGPYQYDSSAGDVAIANGTFAYHAGLTDAEAGGFIGGTHYALTGFDMSFMSEAEYNLSWTMGCGNDHLTASVPEPTTIGLLAIGLLGLAFARRKA